MFPGYLPILQISSWPFLLAATTNSKLLIPHGFANLSVRKTVVHAKLEGCCLGGLGRLAL
jgi:hypothetical protein